MRSAKLVTLIIWFVGIGVLIGLTIWSGADLVGHAIVNAGWAVAFVVLIRIASLAAAGRAWWLLFPREWRPSAWICVLLRFVREATNALLPLAQIGGDFIGARCLSLYGTKGTVAAASVTVDILVQAVTQLMFAAAGLVLLVALSGHELLVWPIAVGVAVAIPLLAAFFLVQGRRGQALVSKVLGWVAPDRRWQVFGTVDDLFARLTSFYAHRSGLIHSGLWHLAAWFIGALEVWIVLQFMGYPVSFEQAVIIESLMHAVRGAAFAIPGALGAQEGGLVVLCAIFGIPSEAALALSLVKRIPDLVLGVPGLFAWQAIEGRHFFWARRAGG
jgi:putative membrane protein